LFLEKPQRQGGIKGGVKNRSEVLAQFNLHGYSPFSKSMAWGWALGLDGFAHNAAWRCGAL
jgi:hypothetical protein